MVLSGHRALQLPEAERWGVALGLDGAELEHFAALVGLALAPTEALREEVVQRVRIGRDRWRARRLEDPAPWTGSWLHLALLQAASRPGFDGNSEVLAGLIWPPVDAEAVEEALADLCTAGLLHPAEGWRTDQRAMRTLETIPTEALSARARQLHKSQLQHAAQALRQRPATERMVSSVTMSVQAERV